MRTVRSSVVACLALLLAVLASVPCGAQDAQASRGAVRIELESLAGEVRLWDAALGPLTSLRAEGAAFVRYTERRLVVPPTLDVGELAEVRLVGGDRVRGVLRHGAGDTLDIDLGGASLTISVEALASVTFEARIPRASTSTPAPSATSDVLYISAGEGLDRAEGLVEAFDSDGLVFEDSRVGRRTYPWTRVAALFIAKMESGGVGTDSPRPEGGAGASGAPERLDPVVVALVGGGRLSGRLRSLDALHVELSREPGGPLSLPAELATEVALADGSFVYLSDLPVADGGPVSLFGDDLGFTWPHRVDQAVDGGPLRVAGHEEARGLGVHAPSRLTWRLDGGHAQFRFGLGVDDSGVGTERSGSVRFRVLGDGRPLYESGLVRAGQPALNPPALAVAGVRELVLEVDPDGDFVLDRADWLRPLLVRGER